MVRLHNQTPLVAELYYLINKFNQRKHRMKFIKTPNDHYVVAKRVSIELEKHKDILVPGIDESFGKLRQ